MKICETKTYKYLGIIINRQLTDTDHIKQHLSKKVKKMEGYIRYTLASHMDINRVNFGMTIWDKVILLSISHAAPVWFNDTASNKKALLSFQNECARAILKLKTMPARMGLLAELGWLPITDKLDIDRIKYFEHLQKMDNRRLPKVIFNLVKTTSPTCRYLRNIKNIMEEQGMDYMFENDELLNTATFTKAVHDTHKINFHSTIEKYNSLKLFCRLLPESCISECSPYLRSKSGSFYAKHLKLKMRTGTLGLGEDLLIQKRGSGLCPLCGAFETVKHFIFTCLHYSSIRKDMYDKLLAYDVNAFNMFISNFDFATSRVLGSHDNHYNEHFLLFLENAWTLRKMMFLSLHKF